MAAGDDMGGFSTRPTGLVARRLCPGEADTALRLCPFEDVDAEVIDRELAVEANYCWMALFAPNGSPVAVHRAMRWQRHLLLKGVFVDDSHRGSGAALGVAFAIRDWARTAGYDGVAAWIEPNKPEARLATRLRLRWQGPLLHRYLVPLPCARGALSPRGPEAAVLTAGTLAVALPGAGSPMVPDLLGTPQEQPASSHLSWVLDRSRLVLSGNPCRSIGDLNALVAAADEMAGLTGATAVEIPVEAADVQAALRLVGSGARRLSRSPVGLGRLSFTGDGTPQPTGHTFMSGVTRHE